MNSARKILFSALALGALALMQAKLASCYATVDDIDLWMGALSEDHVNGGQVGELIFTVLRNQFTRLRDGDRFWYQTYLPAAWAKYLEGQTLAMIIRRNTPIGSELQRDVFQVPTHSALARPRQGCLSPTRRGSFPVRRV